MRTLAITLAALLALAACEASHMQGSMSSGAGYGGARQMSDAEVAAEVEMMQARYDDWREQVMQARDEAAATGRPIPPEVNAEADELMARDLGGPPDADRLNRLRDAVADARRLAELIDPA